MSSTGSKAPLDPNVKIPAAVLRASEAASAAHKNAYTPGTEPPADNVTQPGNEPPANTAPAPAPAPFANVTPPADLPDEGSWENRYKSIKGRWDRAQVTMQEQQRTISGLENNVAGLTSRLAGMETMLARLGDTAPAPAAQPKELQASSFLTQEDKDAFGEDLLAAARRAAREEFEPERLRLQEEIDTLRGNVGQVVTHVAEDARTKMFSTLDSQLPKWREQNRDPQFLAWLRLQDPYSGAIRKNLLDGALAENNAHRVIAIFKGFLSEGATVAPAGQTAPASDGRPSLEDLAAPGRAKTEAGQQTPSEKPIITRAEIAAFYRDVRGNKYAGRDDEKKRLEEMIFDAERDGRIR